jgi:myo-inositol-1(or 4)-monophosphatase
MSLSNYDRVLAHVCDELKCDDLRVAIEAARLAGAEISKGWSQASSSHRIDEKGFGDLVSQVDVLADKAVLNLLETERPGDAVMSEELNPEVGMDSHCERLWIVDPLDGTVGFLFHAAPDQSSTLIALRVGNETELGVVFFPIVDEWYYAVRGRGTFRNGARLAVNEASAGVQLAHAWIDLNQYSDVAYETDEFARLRVALRSKGGTGARLVTSYPAHSGVACYIARGERRVHAVVHDNNTEHVKQGPWDVAAPQIVLEEAGGVYLNGRTGKRYDALEPANIIVAAANASLANALVSIVRNS